MEYHSGAKKSEMTPRAAARMQREIITLRGASRKEKDGHHITYTQNLKQDAKEPAYETGTEPRK